MTFLRLRRGHVIAGVAALALLLVMALDWSSTDLGEDARRIEGIQDAPEPGVAGEVTRDVVEDARIVAEEEERTAWQPGSALDWILLLGLIASVLLALGTATLRATGRSYGGTISPSMLTAMVGSAAAVLVMLFIVQVGALEVGGQVEPGAPLGLLAVGTLAIGAALAVRAERAEAEVVEQPSTAPRERTARRS